MIKRFMALVLVTALVFGTLAGCGTYGGSGAEADSGEMAAVDEADGVEKPPVEGTDGGEPPVVEGTDGGENPVVEEADGEKTSTVEETEPVTDIDRGAVLSAHRLTDVIMPEYAPFPDGELLSKEEGWDEYNRQFEAWYNERLERQKSYDNNVGALYSFYRNAVPVFLNDDGRENHVFSPLNVYLALVLLAEITDGGSRAQILDVLMGENADAREDVLYVDDEGEPLEVWEWRARQLIKANSEEDSAVTSLLANSLWFDDGGDINADTVEKIAVRFGAETFAGKMGSEDMDTAIRAWLDDNTGGLLTEQSAGVSFEPLTVLALASTVYFKASWADKFDESLTEKGDFYGPDGVNSVDMMRGLSISRDYFREEGLYQGTSLDLEYSGRMYLILPDEGVSPSEVLKNKKVISEICGMTTDDREGVPVNVSLPRFDVSSELELSDGMRELGITDVFDSEDADFSPVLKRKDARLSEARCAARVAVDEEGVLGAAFTVMMTESAALDIDEPIELIFDRPFIFAITADDGSLLFVGVVNRPEG